MKKLTIRDTRRPLSYLDRLLAAEGEVTITRRGEAIARVIPIGKKMAGTLSPGPPRENASDAERKRNHSPRRSGCQMRENIYFDTSALAKWYLNEARSEDVEKYIQEHGPVNISDLTVVEMRCLLARRRREKSIDSKNRDSGLRDFPGRYS